MEQGSEPVLEVQNPDIKLREIAEAELEKILRSMIVIDDAVSLDFRREKNTRFTYQITLRGISSQNQLDINRFFSDRFRILSSEQSDQENNVVILKAAFEPTLEEDPLTKSDYLFPSLLPFINWLNDCKSRLGL